VIDNISKSAPSYIAAFEKVGLRDEKDAPYVALYLSIESHGILTQDKHIKEIPQTKIWESMEMLAKLLVYFKAGQFHI
jgi:predicted nucleic acid-binding protein